MRALQALMMMLGALAVLMTSAASAHAMPDNSPAPPCHDSMAHGSTDAPASSPEKAMTAMDCCVAWATTPALLQPQQPRAKAPAPTVVAAPWAVPAGERPAPEPHPPRRSIS